MACSLILQLLVLAFLPALASAHTIAEITTAPTTFDQQSVTVVGEVANMITRYGDTPYTTFDLLDANEVALPVFTWGTPAFKQGDLCHVMGTFVQEKSVGAYLLIRGIEAEKVEKVSAAKYKTAGPLFRKKRKGEKGSESTYPRGFYLPE
jgi:hypothetical protein